MLTRLSVPARRACGRRALAGVDRAGESKLAKYGESILGLLAS